MIKSQWQDLNASLKHQENTYLLQGRVGLTRGTRLGEVEVTNIDNVPTQQFLSGMPKISYLRDFAQPLRISGRAIAASFTQKLDGTALIFSPFKLPNGKMIVFPRTRGMMIVRNTKWRALKNIIDRIVTTDLKAKITTVCTQQNATLVFELWGRENPHIVQYDRDLALSLHTVIKGRNGVQPWRLVKQIAKSYHFPIVEELARVKAEKLTVEELQRIGQQLIVKQEQKNDPDLGLYRQEGVILNIESQSKGWQWKLKPPSMEEYHRLSGVRILPITVYHSIWKLIDFGEDASLDSLLQAMQLEYGEEAIARSQDMISHYYRLWYSKYYEEIIGDN
ncbi:MAG: RNA ligase [Cyanobacteria bacterium P01_E01_bin.42]